MSNFWDESLHDTFDPKVYGFLKYNFDFMKSYSEFLKRRCKIEDDYAREIKKLCHDYRPKNYDEKDKTEFTLQSSFRQMLQELVSVANQHELLREELRRSAKKTKDELVEVRRSEEAVERQVSQLQRSLDRRAKLVESARQQYQKAHVEMTRAAERYEVNKDRMDISKLEEERLRDASLMRKDQCEEKQNSYAKELSDYNDCQRQLFTQQLPEQLATLERLHARLSEFCVEQFNVWAQAEQESQRISSNCLISLADHANSVNAGVDAERLLNVTVSGNPVPQDLQFQDCAEASSLAASTATEASSEATAGGRPKRLLRSLIGSKSNAAVNAPAQRRRRMQEQVKKKSEELQKIEKQIEAAQRMMEVYRNNPSTGNESTVKQQLEVMQGQAVALKEEMEQLELQLRDEGSVCQGSSRSNAQAVTADVFKDEFNDDDDDDDDEAVDQVNGRPRSSRSPSVKSSSSTQQAPPPPPPPRPPASTEPVMVMQHDFFNDELPNNLRARSGERLRLLRRESSGWAWVARVEGDETGFVPLDWLEAAE